MRRQRCCCRVLVEEVFSARPAGDESVWVGFGKSFYCVVLFKGGFCRDLRLLRAAFTDGAILCSLLKSATPKGENLILHSPRDYRETIAFLVACVVPCTDRMVVDVVVKL